MKPGYQRTDICAMCGCICTLPPKERRCTDCRHERITRTCEFCGREFTLRISQVGSGKRFCRGACQQGRVAGPRVGPNHARLAAKIAAAVKG